MNRNKILTIIAFMCFFLVFSSCKGREFTNVVKKIDERIAGEKYDDAYELVQKAKEDNPGNQELLRLEGIALIGKGSYEEAVQVLDEALSLNRRKKPGLIERDMIYYKAVALGKLGKYELANSSLDSIINEKGQKDAFLLRGMLSLKLGKKQDAVLAFDKAIEYDKNNLQLYIDIFRAFAANNYLQSGKDYLSSGIRVAQKAEDNLNLGRLFYYNEEYEMAIKTLENENKDSLARVYMAKAMYKKGDIKSAYQIAENAVANNEQNGEYYNIIGLYHMSNHDYKNAMSSFSEGLKLKDLKNDCELRYNEAVAYEFIGDFSTARQKMESLIHDYPELESAKREFMFLKTR